MPRSESHVVARWNRTPVPARVAERAFLRHVTTSDGCWISTYSCSRNSGYAQIGWQDGGERHTVLAHRAAWVHVNGQVPLGMTLDHLCKTRRCVNPSHLRVISNRENAQRNQGDDWPLGFCRNGHPDALRVATTQGTRCGECHRIDERRRRARRRDARR